MNVSEIISLWGVIISGLGVVVTTVLTIVIIKLTKTTAEASRESAKAAKESADAARESYELSKRMHEIQSKNDTKSWESLRKRYKSKVVSSAAECHTALMKAYSVKMNPQAINDISGMRVAPRNSGLTDEQLAEYFIDEEIEVITKAWESFNIFIGKYYKDPYNSDDELRAISAVGAGGGPIERFYNLKELLIRE